MNLSSIRKEKGISISQLAQLTNLSRRTLEDIERRKDCPVSTAISIATALQVSLTDLCIPKGGSKLMYKYHLTDATIRTNTNLCDFQSQIENSIYNIFPNVTVNTFPDYFEIISNTALSSTGLREMGKTIANSHPILRQMVKTYYYTRSNGQQGQSNQLFKSFQ